MVSLPLQGFGLAFCFVVLPFGGVGCFFSALEAIKNARERNSPVHVPQRAGLPSSIHILTLCLSPFLSSVYYCIKQSALPFPPERTADSQGLVWFRIYLSIT